MEETKEIITISKLQKEKSYILSYRGTWLFRFANTAFGSKWCGLWHIDKKFLDYWAFNINNQWLNWNNLVKFEYCGDKAIHYYQIGKLDIKETINIGFKGLKLILDIKNHGKKTKVISKMELGVNIRWRDENITKRKYKVEKGKSLVVGNEVGFINIKSDFLFIKKPKRLIHWPGLYVKEMGWDWIYEEKQEKLIPGEFVRGFELKRGERRKIKTSISLDCLEGIWREEKEERVGKFSYSKELAKVYKFMRNYLFEFEDKSILIAGFPYFNEFWSRDAFWMIKPYIWEGFWKEMRDTIEFFAKYQFVDGQIPQKINSLRVYPPVSDSTPLFIISLYEYTKLTGKKDLLIELEDKIKKALDYGRKIYNNGLFECDPSKTWMDSIKRGEYPVDIQTLWIKAFEYGSKMIKDKELFRMSKEGKRILKEKFWNGEFFVDSLTNKRITPNGILPFYFKMFNKKMAKKAFNVVERELLNVWGVRSLSREDPDYDGSEYHEGRIWGLTTYWYIHSLFNYGFRRGKELLDLYLEKLGERCLFSFVETWHGEKRYPMGAISQLWSTAWVPYIIDRFILGIKLKKGKIKVNTDLKAFKRILNLDNRKVFIKYKIGEI